MRGLQIFIDKKKPRIPRSTLLKFPLKRTEVFQNKIVPWGTTGIWKMRKKRVSASTRKWNVNSIRDASNKNCQKKDEIRWKFRNFKKRNKIVKKRFKNWICMMFRKVVNNLKLKSFLPTPLSFRDICLYE